MPIKYGYTYRNTSVHDVIAFQKIWHLHNSFFFPLSFFTVMEITPMTSRMLPKYSTIQLHCNPLTYFSYSQCKSYKTQGQICIYSRGEVNTVITCL